MFANSASEYYCIGPAHRSQKRADILPRPIAKDLDSQAHAAVIVLLQFLFQDLHVIGQAGDAEQSGLRVQKRLDLVCGEPFLGCDEVDDRRVEIARARPHYQALKRRHAHRGVYGMAVTNCRGRAAVTQVECDRRAFVRV